jgi:hypothetical protein
LTKGTADFPKAKAYQKIRMGAVELDDLYGEESESEELRDTASEQLEESSDSISQESSSSESSEMKENWWEEE